jgi:TRAP-type mannitol/chloroaromatic compound transport system permease small subunit
VASVIVSSRLGTRLPRLIPYVASLVLFTMPLILVFLSWQHLGRAWRSGENQRWRVWVSVAGCVAFSIALAVPCLVALLTLNWLTWSIACLGAGMLTLLAGVFAARGLRFPLILGGATVVSLVILTPIGIL